MARVGAPGREKRRKGGDEARASHGAPYVVYIAGSCASARFPGLPHCGLRGMNWSGWKDGRSERSTRACYRMANMWTQVGAVDAPSDPRSRLRLDGDAARKESRSSCQALAVVPPAVQGSSRSIFSRPRTFAHVRDVSVPTCRDDPCCTTAHALFLRMALSCARDGGGKKTFGENFSP